MKLEDVALPKGKYLIESVYVDTDFKTKEPRVDADTGQQLYKMLVAVVPDGYRKPERIFVRVPHKQDLTKLPYGTEFSGFDGLTAVIYSADGELTSSRVAFRARRLVREKSEGK